MSLPALNISGNLHHSQTASPVCSPRVAGDTGASFYHKGAAVNLSMEIPKSSSKTFFSHIRVPHFYTRGN